MQNQSKTKSKSNEHNTKFFAKQNLMNMAKAWSKQFSDKHKNDTNKEFNEWLYK